MSLMSFQRKDHPFSVFLSALTDILDIVVQHMSFGDGTKDLAFFLVPSHDFAVTNQRGQNGNKASN